MNPGELFLVGATHRTAPLGMRERLALGEAGETALAAELTALPGLREFVILHTCNRLEIYGVATTAQPARQVAAILCARQNIAPADFDPVKLDLTGREVVQHLLDVASGLDSQMIGENEIFGQAKKALATAQARQSTGPILNRVFQKAFQAAKQVRTDTGITSGLVSVANVAVEVTARIFGQLNSTHVLLLGAGDIGMKAGRAFRHRGVGALTIASRRLERAQAGVEELGAQAVPFEEALARLGEFDVVACSTSSPGFVISTAQVAAAVASRGGRPLFLIDLAMPRDIEAGAANLKNVFVYNLDDLAGIAAENRAAREAEIIQCRAILAEKADALWAGLQRRNTEPIAFPPPAGAVACLA
ncbi:MAG TPA: glutamyl-tRNA reductase [Lacunisphaera sp.]